MLGFDLAPEHHAALTGIDAKPAACRVRRAILDTERGFGGEAGAIAKLQIGAARGGERNQNRGENDSLNAE